MDVTRNLADSAKSEWDVLSHTGVVPRFCLNKTPLERKLILLCTILALTTFCLIIAVAVLDHKYHEAEQNTSTVAPVTTTTPTTPIPTTATPSNTTSQPTTTTQQTTSSATTSATTTTIPTTTNATTPTPTTTKPTSPTTATTTTAPTSSTTSATTSPSTTTANSTTRKSEIDASAETTPISIESSHSTDISKGTIPDSSVLNSRLRRNPTDLPYKSKGTTFDVSKWIVVIIAFICMCQ